MLTHMFPTIYRESEGFTTLWLCHDFGNHTSCCFHLQLCGRCVGWLSKSVVDCNGLAAEGAFKFTIALKVRLAIGQKILLPTFVAVY